MHKKHVDVLHVEILKGYLKGLGWVVMPFSPEFSDDCNVGARYAALSNRAAYDGLYAV